MNHPTLDALKDAEEYVSQYTQPGNYGVGIDADHERYVRLPLLEKLRAAIAAAPAAVPAPAAEAPAVVRLGDWRVSPPCRLGEWCHRDVTSGQCAAPNCPSSSNAQG